MVHKGLFTVHHSVLVNYVAIRYVQRAICYFRVLDYVGTLRSNKKCCFSSSATTPRTVWYRTK